MSSDATSFCPGLPAPSPCLRVHRALGSNSSGAHGPPTLKQAWHTPCLSPGPAPGGSHQAVVIFIPAIKCQQPGFQPFPPCPQASWSPSGHPAELGRGVQPSGRQTHRGTAHPPAATWGLADQAVCIPTTWLWPGPGLRAPGQSWRGSEVSRACLWENVS